MDARRIAATLWPGWLGLPLAAAPALLGLADPLALLAPLLVAGALALWLPHAGADLLVAARLGHASRRRSLGVAAAAYLLGGGLAAAAWALVPALGLVILVVVAWAHFGLTDLRALDAVGADHVADPRDRWLAVAARGGAPVVLPALFYPDPYREAAVSLLAVVDPVTAQTVLDLLAPTFRLLAVAWLGTLAAGSLVRGWQAGGDVGWRIDLAETAILWATLLLAPPVAGLAAYLALWHGGHALAWLLAAGEGGDPSTTRRDLRGLARDAAPGTALLLALLALVWATGAAPVDPDVRFGLGVVAATVFVVPHAALGLWAGASADPD